MNVLDLYLKYKKDWVGRRTPAPPLAIPGALRSPKRIAACLGADPRLPPLVMPALRLVRERFAGARLLVVAGPDNVYALRRERIADKALAMQSKKGSALVKEIRRVGREIGRLDPDLFLLLEAVPEPALLALAYESRVPLRAGFGRGEHAPFLNLAVEPPKKSPYLAQALLDMVGAITGRFVDFLDDRVRWRIPEAEAQRADRLVRFWQPRSDDLLVAIEPGAAGGREPDLERYAAVARLLARTYRARIMIVSPPEGRAAAIELERRLAVLDPYRAQADDLPHAVAFLSRADLAVCTDSPLFHYAVALGVPVLGLFPERVDPWHRPPSFLAARILPLQKEITEEKFLAAVDGLGTQVTGGSG